MDKREEFHNMLEANNGEYSKEYDAYYNSATGEWLEPKCSDETCHFCNARPINLPPDGQTEAFEASRCGSIP